MTLNEFSKLVDEDQCSILNTQLKEYGKKGFKCGDIDFTLNQAKKVLQPGIKEVNGQYLTKKQLVVRLEEEEKKERPPVQFTEGDIIKLMQLLEGDRLEILLKITEKYDYIQNYILKADTGIKICKAEKDIKVTTMRLYQGTWEKWQDFCSEHKEYAIIDLLNTALLEYISRHS